MVKEIKAGVSKTRQVLDVTFSILVTVALTAAVVKLATLPEVNSGVGKLPVWQVVAAVLAVVLVGRLWKLHSNDSHS